MIDQRTQTDGWPVRRSDLVDRFSHQRLLVSMQEIETFISREPVKLPPRLEACCMEEQFAREGAGKSSIWTLRRFPP